MRLLLTAILFVLPALTLGWENRKWTTEDETFVYRVFEYGWDLNDPALRRLVVQVQAKDPDLDANAIDLTLRYRDEQHQTWRETRTIKLFRWPRRGRANAVEYFVVRGPVEVLSVNAEPIKWEPILENHTTSNN